HVGLDVLLRPLGDLIRPAAGRVHHQHVLHRPDSSACARSSAATSIFCILISACATRPLRFGSGSLISSTSAVGMICHDSPTWPSTHPQAVGLPPAARNRDQ